MRRLPDTVGIGVFFLYTILFSGLSYAQTKFIKGTDTLIYDIINPKGVCSIPAYTDNGFAQKVISENSYSKTVEVRISLTPFDDQTPYPLDKASLPAYVRQYLNPSNDIQSDDSQIINLAHSLTKNAKTIMQAYTNIINWVVNNLNYQIDTDQDAVSVLSNHIGSCVGYSNLSIALLRAAGIPARYVQGYVPPGYNWGEKKNYWGVTLNSGGFHQWFEVYFPEQGWAFSDAENSKNFVDPFHIVLNIEGENLGSTCLTNSNKINVDKGTSFTVAKEDNTMEPVDEINDTSRLILSRQEGKATHGLIIFTITNEHGSILKDAHAVIWHGLKGIVYPVDDKGRFYFIGHDAGKYHLSFNAPHYADNNVIVDVVDGTTFTKTIVLEPGLSISGTVVDSVTNQPVTNGKVVLWYGLEGKVYPLASNGRFEFDGVKPDKYTITVEAPGYEKFTAKEDASKPVDVNVLIKLTREQ
ncbi:MAG: transglutaminase domain-containing protein [bacterium]